MSDEIYTKEDAISFAPRLVASNNFKALYDEGMSLIEDVASYLDGEGREQSRGLEREASMFYASESMRLTTRLMQLASWLLLQRAVNEGEISAEHARNEKSKVKFSAEPAERGGPGWADMPEKFREFVVQGDRIFARVKRLDAADRGELDDEREKAAAAGGVFSQMSRLQDAFAK